MTRRGDVPSWSQVFWAVLFLTFFDLGLPARATAQSPNLSQGISVANSANRSPFIVAPTFSVSGVPTSVAAGDLNGDGKPDLVITRNGSDDVTVLLGSGNGRFAAGVDYPSGTQPTAVQIGDVDGDGRLDLVVVNRSTGTVNVLFGNSDGTFGKPTQYAAVKDAVSVALGNFGGHGAIDLAVAGSSSQTIALLLNDGSGHFSKPIPYFAGKQIETMTVADVNGDGHPDVVSANSDGSITVLRNSANGTFQQGRSSTVAPSAVSAIAAGDFNGDGKIDLAIIHAGANEVRLLFGRGDGSFQSGGSYATGNHPASLIATDVDGDGVPDLITTNEAGNTFSVLTGNGDGTFKASLDFTAGNGPRGLAVADFNGDGHIDLAILNSLDGTISVPLGNGDGTFRAARAYRADLERKTVTAGDLKGDGRPDLVVANFCGEDAGCKSNGTVTVFLAEPNGTYRAATSYPLGNGPIAAALADVNGDKKLDLIAVNRTDKSYTVMYGNGDGTFSDPLTYVLGKSPLAIVAGDFNKDGKTDLAISSDCGVSSCAQPGEIDILLGRGDGTFAAASSYAVGYSPSSLATGDLNGDGIVDLVVANACGNDSTCQSEGTASLLAGDGKGKFTQSGEVKIGKRPSAIAVDNLGSGVSLFVASREDNQISILQGDGKGAFKSPKNYAVGAAPSSLVVADFDGDGQKDVAVANFQSSTVNVLFGNGDGTLQPAATYSVGTGPESLVAVRTAKTTAASLVSANGNAGSSPMGTDITVLSNVQPQVLTASSTVLSSSPTSSTVNDSVSLTATVTGTGGTPTGNVTFTSNGTTIADCNGSGSAVALDGNGKAVCATKSLQSGTDSLVANYGGDGTFSGSTSNTVSQTVAQATTSTSVNSSSPTSTVNDSVTFTATVTPHASAVPLSGTVTFTDNGTAIRGCAVPVDPTTGVAVCTTSALTGGTHSIVATYGSDTNYSSSNNNVTQSVNPAASATAVASSGSPSTVNQSVTFTATVTPFSSSVKLSGTVTFTDNGNPLATCPTPIGVNPADGQAACTTTALTLGSHTIKAAYATDTSYTSSSGTVMQTVNAASSSTALTSSANPSSVNQSITFTATVTANTGAASLSGSVTFTDNGSAISACPTPVAVNPGTGKATCTTTAFAAGSHTIQAAYGNDTNFGPSSKSITQTVNPANSNTVLTSSANPSTVNQSVTFTATITPISGPVKLSGTVTFTDNGTVISGCSGAIDSTTGVVTCTTTTLTLGSHTVKASYGSDTNFNASSMTVTQAVNPAVSAVALTSSLNPSTVNQAVTFTATVSGAAGQTHFSGTMSFTDNGNALSGCSTAVDPTTGVATCMTLSLTVGAHTIVAKYSGDPNFTTTQTSLTQTANPAASSTTLASSTNPSMINQQVVFTATVTPNNASVKLSGTVTFTDNGSPLTSCVVNFTPATGIATCMTSGLTLGPHSIIATYTDTNYASSHGTINQTVGQATTTLALASSANPSTINEPITFTATVSAAAGSATLAGNVTFTDNGSAIPNCVITVNPVNGMAACTTASLTLGSHTIKATYGNDTNFGGSSNMITQAVNPAPTTTSLISSAPGNTSIINQSVSFTATVMGAAGSTALSGVVNFTDNGAPIAVCTSLPVKPATGVAICTTAALLKGSHTIGAAYANDNNFSSSAASLMQTVNAAATATTLVSSLDPSVVRNPNQHNDTVKFTAAVSPTAGPVLLSGAVTFTDNGSLIPECQAPVPVIAATGIASCTTTALGFGSHTILAVYGSDPNFLSSNSTIPQLVQDYGLTASPTAPVYVTQGYTSTNDLFTSALTTTGSSSIVVTPAPISGFAGTLALSCSVVPVTTATAAVPPACNLGNSTVTINPTSAQTSVSIVIDATNASTTPGAYSVTVTGVDSTTMLSRTTAPFTVYVRATTTAITLVSGAITGNTTNADFILPPNVGLTSLKCASVGGPTLMSKVDPAGLSIGCSFNPTSVPSSSMVQSATVAVTISTNGTAVAELATRTGVFSAGLIGIPVLALLAFLRGEKPERRTFFRFLALLFVAVCVMTAAGCGGHFTRTTTNTGLTPPGTYLILVEGTGTDGLTYDSVIQVDVTR